MENVFKSNEEAIFAEFDDIFSNENPMFEVYRKLASLFNVDLTFAELDFELFKKLKYMITELVLVEPEDRMKLEEAKNKLKELEDFTKTKSIRNFLLLNHFLLIHDDPTLTSTDETTQNSLRLMDEIRVTSTDETTQNSFRLMDEIRVTRLFTIPTTGADKKLTQRLTNLCVSVTAMRLLSYTLVDFLKPYVDAKTWEDLKKTILKYPDNPQSSKKSQEEQEKVESKSDVFIQKLITICCGVISPRSLNGLNYCNLDDDFHVAAQEQNIRE